MHLFLSSLCGGKDEWAPQKYRSLLQKSPIKEMIERGALIFANSVPHKSVSIFVAAANIKKRWYLMTDARPTHTHGYLMSGEHTDIL